MPQQLFEFLKWVFSSAGTTFITKVPDTISLFQSLVQWAAFGFSALAAVYEARRRELDFFGTLAIAFAVAVGGGTLRDVLLGRYPIFWVTSPVYFVTDLIIAATGVFVLAQGEHAHAIVEPLVNPVRRVMRSDQLPGWIIGIDALGLGLWAYLGTQYALQSGASWLVAPMFGVITASFGGVIRDLFFAQIPSIFKRGQLYSTSAAIGSLVYVGLEVAGIAATAGFIACVAITFLMRMTSVRLNIVSV